MVLCSGVGRGGGGGSGAVFGGAGGRRSWPGSRPVRGAAKGGMDGRERGREVGC